MPRTIPARCLALLAPLAACGGGGEPETARPNVILVSIDSLRADHMGCYGYGRRTTPNVDALAREGVLFEQHVSSTSWTLPAHAGLFTSVPDSVHGCVDATETALAPEFETLAERFAAGGYRTAGFYAGPYLHAAFGLGQGFEVYEYAVENATFDGARRDEWANDPGAHRQSHQGVTNDALYGAGRAWLEEHRDEPFFCFLHFWDVHYDFTPPAPWDTAFDAGYTGFVDGTDVFSDPRIGPGMTRADLDHLIALYDGEIGWTDTFVGRLREDLAAWGIDDRTVVAITSDHGTEFFEHGGKGHRRTLFDEVLRVPFVLWYPAGLAPGRVDVQTRSIDVGPTLLELADLAPPAAASGQSLLALARGGALDFDNTALAELRTIGLDLRAVRTAKDKLVHDANRAGDPARWYDLDLDARERRPRALDEGRGPEVHARFLEAIAELGRAIERRPGGPVAVELPADIRGDLEEIGYVGNDED